MGHEQTTFSDRLRRIEGRRDGGNSGRQRDRTGSSARSQVVHPDGFTRPFARSPRRLRFGFPIKGVIFATILTILVKAYLMWVLGDDVYGDAVLQLLGGNQFERAAGLVLAPDRVSLRVVDLYQYLYRFIVSVATALETGTFPDYA
jgi:hypothetical protein